MAEITQKTVWLQIHCGPSKKNFCQNISESTETYKKIPSLNLIKNHASIVTAVTVIIILLITNIKIAIILIAITKNDYHNNNNNNNNNNNLGGLGCMIFFFFEGGGWVNRLKRGLG